MEKIYPKVLIISHNALSKTQNNGKTIETFFLRWPKDSIAHLYLSPEDEDFEFCSNSFCVNDYDALDNFFRIKKRRHGKRISTEMSLNYERYLLPVRRLYYKNRIEEEKNSLSNYFHEHAVNRKPYISFLRQLLWKNKKWFMEDIFDWVEDFQPSIIFFQGSGVHYSYEIVNEISKNFSLPIILECTDDYTIPLYEGSIIDRHLTNKYLTIFKEVIKKSSAIYVISDQMRDEYANLYGGENYYVLSNSIQRNIPDRRTALGGQRNFLYAGNLGLGRLAQIIELGKVLDEIAEQKNMEFKFFVFSGTNVSQDILEEMESVKCMYFKGFISPEELNVYIKDAMYLVHVESFDQKSKKITRLSISTKIGEYLASNRCIIAFGPEDIASIDYLKSKKLGFVIDTRNKSQIKLMLSKLISDENLYRQLINNAYTEYCDRFTQEKIDQTVYQSIAEVVFNDNKNK